MADRVAVLLPAYNEEVAIGLTLDDVRYWLPDAERVVIDNNCTDETVGIARKFGATVIVCKERGKGCAIRKALEEVEADYYMMIDSDYTYPAIHLVDVIRLLKHHADVVIGYRMWQAKGATAKVNKLGNWGLTKIARILYGYPVHDVCSGMWGFRREAVEAFELGSMGFTLEVELFTEAVRTRCRIEQIPIEYRARFHDSNSKLNLRSGLEIGWWMLRKRMR